MQICIKLAQAKILNDSKCLMAKMNKDISSLGYSSTGYSPTGYPEFLTSAFTDMLEGRAARQSGPDLGIIAKSLRNIKTNVLK